VRRKTLLTVITAVFGAVLVFAGWHVSRADVPMTVEAAKGVIQDGQTAYTDDCASCHGKMAKGDGPLKSFLTVKPPDLTQIAKRNNGNFDFWKVYGTIDGEHMLRAHGDSEMPVWGRRYRREWGFAGTRARYIELLFYLQSIQEK
jgi:mono/diheme cytochrome c family protein